MSFDGSRGRVLDAGGRPRAVRAARPPARYRAVDRSRHVQSVRRSEWALDVHDGRRRRRHSISVVSPQNICRDPVRRRLPVGFPVVIARTGSVGGVPSPASVSSALSTLASHGPDAAPGSRCVSPNAYLNLLGVLIPSRGAISSRMDARDVPSSNTPPEDVPATTACISMPDPSVHSTRYATGRLDTRGVRVSRR